MRRFRRFAETEARGHSPLYEALGLGVAGDAALAARLATWPAACQQPNLVFAALRVACGTPVDYADFRAKLLDAFDAVAAVASERTTQTNEPGRCAVLLPVLARLHQPLALIEVGASAGLCLIPDLYAYDYDGKRVGKADAAPVFPCRVNPATPVPHAMPNITWRMGLDLAPVSLRDPAQVAWLEALIWPDQPARLERFRAAARTFGANPVRVRRGDLLGDIGTVIADAPVGPTIVVYHTAVLGYVADPAARAAFAATLWDRSAVWVSNEPPGVLPEIAARATREGPTGAFLLAVNGQPVAWTDPHGGWIDWL